MKALDWLDKNQLAGETDFEAMQKELRGVVNPITMKKTWMAYQDRTYQQEAARTAAASTSRPDGG